MNQRLSIGIAATLLAATVSLVAASPYRRHASERHSVEPRLAANEQIGAVNSAMHVFAPRLSAAPRIIHVPQPGERDEASGGYDDEAALPADEETPPPRAMRRQPRYGETPPHERRHLMSGPPPLQQLTPIYPTPKFDVRSKASEKFSAPSEAAMPSSATRRQN